MQPEKKYLVGYEEASTIVSCSVATMIQGVFGLVEKHRKSWGTWFLLQLRYQKEWTILDSKNILRNPCVQTSPALTGIVLMWIDLIHLRRLLMRLSWDDPWLQQLKITWRIICHETIAYVIREKRWRVDFGLRPHGLQHALSYTPPPENSRLYQYTKATSF